MKYLKPTFLLFLLTLSVSITQASPADSTLSYTPKQLDSIVAAEVQRQVDTALIYLKIDKAANEKLGLYISEQNKQLTQHDFFVGGILTILVGIVGILIPLLMNKKHEERLKKIEEKVKESEIAALQAKISEKLSQIWNEKDFNKQIEFVSQLIGEHPNDEYSANAYFTRGSIYGTHGDHEKAIRDLTMAIRFDPEATNAYYNRALSYEALKEYDNAIADYHKSIELSPDFAFPYNNLAYNLFRKEKFSEALVLVNKAIRLDKTMSEFYDTRCVVYIKLGQLEDALADARTGLSVAKKKGETQSIADFEEKIHNIEEFIKSDQGQSPTI